MCMIRATVAAAILAFSGAAFAADGKGPNLGRPATPDEIAGWDISIPPDGGNLPPGAGTAKSGAAIYAAKCASCHGDKGVGRSAEELAGGIGSLATDNPTLSVGSYWPYATTLFDYVRRAMPPPAPLSLSNDDVYAVCAYVLFLNGLIGEDEALTATTLPKIKMPNRDGFISIYHEPKK